MLNIFMLIGGNIHALQIFRKLFVSHGQLYPLHNYENLLKAFLFARQSVSKIKVVTSPIKIVPIRTYKQCPYNLDHKNF